MLALIDIRPMAAHVLQRYWYERIFVQESPTDVSSALFRRRRTFPPPALILSVSYTRSNSGARSTAV